MGGSGRRSIEEMEAVEFIEAAASLVKDSDYLRSDELTESDSNKENEMIRESLFHNYDSTSYAIVGVANINNLNSILKRENYLPIGLGKSLKGMVVIWVTQRHDSTFGEEVELSASFFVSPKQMGYLGVSYSEGNHASVLFPFFGKLQDHCRFYLFHKSTNNEMSLQFGRQVLEFPEEELKINEFKEENDQILFDFENGEDKLLLKGTLKVDHSWLGFFKNQYRIVRALGLSGAIDLWYSEHITYKKVSPSSNKKTKEDGFVTSVNTDFRKQKFFDVENFEIEFGEETELGEELKLMGFEPKMVVKLENFQEAIEIPKKQSEDLEFLKTLLKMEEEQEL